MQNLLWFTLDKEVISETKEVCFAWAKKFVGDFGFDGRFLIEKY